MGNLVVIFGSIILGAAGQILLKFGANKLGAVDFSLAGLLCIFKNLYIWLGLILFGTSFLLWVKVLTKNDLSYVYPMVSISYIIIILASKFLFNEPFSVNKIIGISAIIIGVFIINR